MTRISMNARGFSLTELLVAMVIGLILLGGLVTLMVNSKKNFSQQDYSARLQENARFAMDFLSYDIRMAGFYGCSNEILNGSVLPITAVDSGDGSPDTITITYGESYQAGQEVVVDGGHVPADGTTLSLNTIPADWNDSASHQDSLIIGDCGNAAIADIDEDGIDTSSSQVTVSPRDGSFTRAFDADANINGPIIVRRLVTHTYAVEDGDSGIPVLTRNGRELVEGVENIQLLYRDLTGGDFVQGSSSLPARLAAVQLAALVRSVSNENLDDREYGSGVEITEDDGPDDNLLDQDVSGVTGTIRGQRRVFNNTLAVRNRTL